MKKRILLFFMTAALLSIANAQNKVTTYCKMTITDLTTFNGHSKGRQQIDIDYGINPASPISNYTAVIVKLMKIKTLTNGIDAMNYMNSIGWELINITCKYSVYTCFYKKDLDN